MFKYLVANDRDVSWGLYVDTIGYEEIKPGEHYPTQGHADGFYFDVNRGRKLDEYQLQYIKEGSGTFRSAHQPETHLRAGDVFLLFPGEWHTYCPDPDKGWKCYWIGFKGRNMDERMKANFLSIEKPVYHIGFSEEFIHVFDKAIEIAEAEAIYSQQTLAGSVNYLIGMMYSLERTYQLNKNKGKADLIHRARLRIRNSVEDDVTIQQIAEETGISYSNFRKLFKEYTGISPALYQQDLKIQRAKNLLSSTTNSIKEIAYKLHFESPDYFSARFRAKTGMRPSTFRTEHGACVPEQQQGNIL